MLKLKNKTVIAIIGVMTTFYILNILIIYYVHNIIDIIESQNNNLRKTNYKVNYVNNGVEITLDNFTMILTKCNSVFTDNFTTLIHNNTYTYGAAIPIMYSGFILNMQNTSKIYGFINNNLLFFIVYTQHEFYYIETIDDIVYISPLKVSNFKIKRLLPNKSKYCDLSIIVDDKLFNHFKNIDLIVQYMGLLINHVNYIYSSYDVFSDIKYRIKEINIYVNPIVSDPVVLQNAINSKDLELYYNVTNYTSNGCVNIIFTYINSKLFGISNIPRSDNKLYTVITMHSKHTYKRHYINAITSVLLHELGHNYMVPHEQKNESMIMSITIISTTGNGVLFSDENIIKQSNFYNKLMQTNWQNTKHC